MKTAAQLIVEALEAQGVERVFSVPGESFLAMLDALRDAPIDVTVCRQEGGAAMMAEATGKLSGRPGVAVVTRGPGATNAAAGLHVAQQDSTPMILFVGQIERGVRGRDAFQEIDLGRLFGGMAKWVADIDAAERVPEMLARAFHTAMAGRPGPVVLGLPEDMLGDAVTVPPGNRIEVSEPAPREEDTAAFRRLLGEARRPIVVAGGSRWSPAAVEELRRFSERFGLPVACSFRRQMLFDHRHPHYAGDLGLGVNPQLRQILADADLIVLLGGRFSENPSQGYTALGIPMPSQRLVHVHPGPEEIGRVYTPTLGINATAGAFLASLVACEPPEPLPWAGMVEEAHDAYRSWSDAPATSPGSVDLGAVLAWLRDNAPTDCILTNGAGNYTAWIHRYWRYGGYGSQVAPTSGSMGYGLPAAIAAQLAHPRRTVICFAGDGCFQMTMQEFGTAAQARLPVVVVLIDNGMYGTIRMHQERRYPGRVTATDLANPDFAAFARLYGGHGETVDTTAAFAPAWKRAIASGRPSILHLRTDPEAITPSTTLSAIRQVTRSPATRS